MSVIKKPVINFIKIPVIGLVIFFISLACYGIVLVDLLIHRSQSNFMSESTFDFLAILVLLVAMTIAMFFIQKRLLFRIFLIFRITFLLILMYIEVDSVAISFALITTFIAEVSIYEPFPVNIILCLSVSCISFSILRYSLPNIETTLPVYFIDKYIFLLYAIFVSFFASYMIHYREGVITLQKEVERLGTLSDALAKANIGYQEYAKDTEERSMKHERQRITREIHDIVGYTMTNNIMIMEAATDMVKQEPEKVSSLINIARENAIQGLEEIRRELRLLRKKEIASISGIRGIIRLIKIFEVATKVHVKVQLSGNIPWNFGENIDLILHHFVQEGLINSFRHGKAERVSMLLWITNGVLHANILDNGIGAKDLTEGIGISGMRERAEDIGGKFCFGNKVDGFEISLSIPLRGNKE